MDAKVEQSMHEYYSERASEYEEMYTRGRGPASVPDPNAYKSEVKALSGIVQRRCFGRLIDIACGTAFWLPYYASQCSHIVLLDQSREMLAEAQKKVTAIGIEGQTSITCGDFLSQELAPASFDCALVGFFLSHLTEAQEQVFFEKLATILKPGGEFLILDSAWGEERAKTRQKEGTQERLLNDGRRFDVYKRYFDKKDIASMEKEHNLKASIEHFGRVFLAVSAAFRTG